MVATEGEAGLEASLRLRDDATAEMGTDGRLLLSRGSKRFALGPLVDELSAPLEILLGTGAPEAQLRAAAPPGDAAAASLLASVLDRLDERGWIQRELRFHGVPLVTVKPLVARMAHASPASVADGAVVLSRFALLHRAGGEMVLESPRSSALAVLHDARVAAFVASLARPARVADLAAGLGLPAEVLTALAALLVDVTLLVGADGDEEDSTMALAQWSLPDLFFHSRSRQGRHANGYGATWPLRDRFPPLPLVDPPATEVVHLRRPDISALASCDPSFTTVLEGRQSRRLQDDDAPITVGQLGEFLYRSAGVRHEVTTFSDGSPRPLGMARPYPTGGALYELELYPVVRHCDGLDPGLYHYDPVRHQLGVVTAGLNPGIESLLQQTCAKTGMRDRPQVLLAVTARFGKVMFKYEAIPYATILKNVGVLYQTMYLVATAMGLAPCAVGGGDSDAFAALAGLNYYEETSVGEFLVGSRPSVSSGGDQHPK